MEQDNYPMQEMEIPGFVWDKIAIDTIGPYPTSYCGSRYFITLMDLFTSYPEVYPVPDKSKRNCGKILTHKLNLIHPCPTTILSDNGRRIQNKTVDKVSKKLGISRVFQVFFTHNIMGN